MFGFLPPATLSLPPPLQRRIDSVAREFLQPVDEPGYDFLRPDGEEALVPPQSLSWRIFKNPAVLFVGGIAAVILELAEPGVRSGVWEHSGFRSDPVKRLRRTGLAAMVTIYGARSVAQRMIAGVVRMHDSVSGETPTGERYRANDVALLDWVQATASFGFANAYGRYVRYLDAVEIGQLYAEAVPAAQLYGALGAPASQADWDRLLESMRDRLEPHPIVGEFLDIMRDATAFPAPLRPVQRMLVRAGVDIVPTWVRERLGLDARHGLRGWERPLVRQLTRLSDRLMLPSSPAVQSCLRLGLPSEYLYRR
jgi:uncharacterized protein (DUF2236 family)